MAAILCRCLDPLHPILLEKKDTRQSDLLRQIQGYTHLQPGWLILYKHTEKETGLLTAESFCRIHIKESTMRHGSWLWAHTFVEQDDRVGVQYRCTCAASGARTFDDAVTDCRRSVARVAVVTTRPWRLRWMKVHSTSGGCLWWPWGVRTFIVPRGFEVCILFQNCHLKSPWMLFHVVCRAKSPHKSILKIWPEFFCMKFRKAQKPFIEKTKTHQQKEKDTPTQTQSLN